MRKNNTVIVVGILMLGNLTVALQASVPIDFVRENRAFSRVENTEARISRLLEERGLESQAAHQKARAFCQHSPHLNESGLRHLTQRLSGPLSPELLDAALTRRALFERSVDLTSADSLAALYQDATGMAPDERTLAVLHDVASLNRAISA